MSFMPIKLIMSLTLTPITDKFLNILFGVEKLFKTNGSSLTNNNYELQENDEENVFQVNFDQDNLNGNIWGENSNIQMFQ